MLRWAADVVALGGLLLAVSHRSSAPWSWNHDPGRRYPTPQEELAALALDPASWEAEPLTDVDRQITGPGGQTAAMIDIVLALRRR